jgi:glyoxylate/hydroxypyruvate reductase A
LLYEPAFRRLEPRLSSFSENIDAIIFERDGSLRAGRRAAEIEVAWASPDLFIDRTLKSFMARVRDASALRWFQCGSAGYDNPLLRGVIDRGIAFSTNPAPALSVAEYVMASVLDHFQGGCARRELATVRSWSPMGFREVAGSTWLIVGLGTIGRRVARLAKAFEARVVGVSLSGRECEYADEVRTRAALTPAIAAADVVVLALPLDASTRGLVNAEFLGRMKPASVLVNVARGAIVLEADLTEALDRGTPGHAVLDVFETEPLDRDSRLWTHPRVSLTAHVAGMGSGLLERSDGVFPDNLDRYLAGESVPGTVQPAANGRVAGALT